MKSLSSNKTIWLGLPITISLIGGIFLLGHYFGETKFDEQKNTLYQQNKNAMTKLDSIRDSLKRSNRPLASVHASVMMNGSLTSGFGMGINTSEGRTDWMGKVADAQVMKYPGARSWGAAFVTVGNPVKAGNRPTKDFSRFTSLSVEIKGTTGNTVNIGLKSDTDNDDGSETRYPITFVNNEWNIYAIKLDKFISADLKHLYVVSEFVFDEQPQTISVRNIQFFQ